MTKLLAIAACVAFFSSIHAQAPGVSDQDKKFAECALQANQMELRLSEMGLSKGFSPEVKELALHLQEDHKKSDVVLRQLITDRSIAVEGRLNADQENELKELNEKEGEAFDKAYATYTARIHKQTIRVYEKQARKGENTELRAFANNSLTQLNHHKNMADATCKKLKGKK